MLFVGVSFILQSEALFLVFQKCFYESLTKIKKVSNTGILLIELDIHCYEEVIKRELDNDNRRCSS